MHDPLVGPHLAKLHILAQARTTGLSVSQWRAWLTGEYHCQIAEVAAFATMAARMPHDARAAAFFTELAQLILLGRPALLAAARPIRVPIPGREYGRGLIFTDDDFIVGRERVC